MTTLLDELIAHRDNKKDKRVFGLVLQGGGMRAVYSAGAAAPLITYGVVDSFDHVVGSSAGAINGAYMLGSDPETLRTYTDDLTNKNFVNLLRRDKRVDIDYLVDMVLQHKRPLNLANLRAAHAQLHVVMTDAKNGRKVVVSDHHQFTEIYEEFRATAALPFLYDKKVLVAGKYFIDGGVADLLPLDVAIKLGCTDIVVVMTQQLASYDFSKRHARLANRLMRRFATEQAAAVRAKLPTDEHLLQQNLRRITHPLKTTRVYLLEPSDEEFLVTRITTDKPKIEALAKLGIQDMDAFLHKTIV
jgi:predicted patatin/cPLA2 family phospholipase